MFFNTFDKNRSGRRRRSTTRDGIREGKSEFYYGEDVVKLSKGRREFEFVRCHTNCCLCPDAPEVNMYNEGPSGRPLELGFLITLVVE